jgi:hypothetical protein
VQDGAAAAAVVAAAAAEVLQQKEQKERQQQASPSPSPAAATTTSPAATTTNGGQAKSCHQEAHADYNGETVVQWGASHHKDSAAECCAACAAKPPCDVWVWCGDAAGCGTGKHRECWLKKAERLNLAKPAGMRGASEFFVFFVCVVLLVCASFFEAAQDRVLL